MYIELSQNITLPYYNNKDYNHYSDALFLDCFWYKVETRLKDCFFIKTTFLESQMTRFM